MDRRGCGHHPPRHAQPASLNERCRGGQRGEEDEQEHLLLGARVETTEGEEPDGLARLGDGHGDIGNIGGGALGQVETPGEGSDSLRLDEAGRTQNDALLRDGRLHIAEDPLRIVHAAPHQLDGDRHAFPKIGVEGARDQETRFYLAAFDRLNRLVLRVKPDHLHARLLLEQADQIRGQRACSPVVDPEPRIG